MDSRLVTWLRRNVKWKKWTPYYQTTLMHTMDNEYGHVYCKGEQNYLVNSEGEVGKIPRYVAMEVSGMHWETGRWGPYIFYNHFEDTDEAAYLRKMFQYPTLTEAAQKKVTDIFFENNLWIRTDTEFVDMLNKREEAIRNGK